MLSSIPPPAPGAPPAHAAARSTCYEPSLAVAPAGPARPATTWLDELRFLLTAKAVLLNAMGVHLIVLFVLFQHYFYHEWTGAIEVGGDDPGPLSNAQHDPLYWMKLIIICTEAAGMFLLLWGTIVLPLSMCRHLANKLSGMSAARWLPLAHLTEFHRFAGMHMVGQLIVVLFLFMGLIGKLCATHLTDPAIQPVNHCTGPTDDGVDFPSEIMMTGYALLAVSLLIGIPALTCSRRVISYEVRLPHLLDQGRVRRMTEQPARKAHRIPHGFPGICGQLLRHQAD